ncbi:MAG: molybdopterin oxidoreductase, partial [Actinobacteria bacterium]|nr:molybdopterin oxidoreductase [Actinomycetota bacterium]
MPVPEAKTSEPPTLTRREFLSISSAVGGGAAFLGAIPKVEAALARTPEAGGYPLARLENQIASVCLQCNTICGIKVKLLDGVAVKIDGNPYSPWTLSPHLDYATPLAETAAVDGAICPKGQAGLQTAYDPYRIVRVMKRAPGTRRGENQWVTIDFDQALQEIVDGGNLFGEGQVPGLRESYALTGPDIAKEMAAAVKAILAEKDLEEKGRLVEAFKKTFAAHLDTLIDPDHPDFGPRNNQVVFNWGRL